MIQQLRTYYEPYRNPTNAAAMTAYLKGLFPFFGMNSPKRREINRLFLLENTMPNVETLSELTKEAWLQDERDFQHFMMEFWEKYKKEWTEETIVDFEYMISNKSWWDTVDFIATHLVGKYFLLFPHQIQPITEKWMTSGNMWLQRACLIFQLHYKEKTDIDLLYAFILQLNTSKEFFIQKAIGWALRQLAKREPETVRKFVLANKLMPLSKREALKHIGENPE